MAGITIPITMAGTVHTPTTGTGGTDGAIGHIATIDGKLFQRPHKNTKKIHTQVARRRWSSFLWQVPC